MSQIDFRNDIIYLIRHLNKLLQNDFDERIAKFDLTGQQARILFYINKKTVIDGQEMHQNDLEQGLKLAKSTVNGLITRLEKKGFIAKTIVRPYSIINITDKGKAVIDELKEGRAKTVDRLFKGLTEEEKERTIKQINKVLMNFEGGNDNVAKN